MSINNNTYRRAHSLGLICVTDIREAKEMAKSAEYFRRLFTEAARNCIAELKSALDTEECTNLALLRDLVDRSEEILEAISVLEECVRLQEQEKNRG